jgi:Domain of unknown function (DUF222)
MTTGQLRAHLGRLIITVDPASARDRYEQKLKDRRVISEMTDAGTANLLGLDLPPADTNAVMRRINRLARTAKKNDDPRTIDQIRADILLDLLTGRNQTVERGSGGNRAVVDIRVAMTTLAGQDDQPGEIPGWGPVLADVAVTSSTNNPNRNGGSPSPTKSGNPQEWSPPEEDPASLRNGSWRPGIRPVSFPDVACPPANAISTMRSPGQNHIGPPSENSDRYVATTTTTIIATGGN